MNQNLEPRILIVDDDPVIRHVVSKSLAEAGFTVQTATNGAEGVALARAWSPALVLSDVMMPEMDGYQLCRALRQDPRTSHLPIILLTAMDETDSVVRGLQAGADDYMVKPFQIAELVARVKTHLRRTERDVAASPLTGLPGNAPIEQVINERIRARALFAVMYIDLTNFKSYNDEFGWLQGDAVIRMLASQIIDAVRECGTPQDFIGHIGGDDFIVVTVPARAETMAQQIVARFDGAIEKFYPAEIFQRGYINAVNRQGQTFRAPIVTVAVAIVTNRRRVFTHIGQIGSAAADVKKYVKALPGSGYAFDRRQN